jgi:hypothetical protein
VIAAPVRFLDAQGFAWTVTEVRPVGVPESLGALYFFSGGSTLRLKTYPPHWAELTWPELERLRHLAEVMTLELTRRSVPRHHGDSARAEL